MATVEQQKTDENVLRLVEQHKVMFMLYHIKLCSLRVFLELRVSLVTGHN